MKSDSYFKTLLITAFLFSAPATFAQDLQVRAMKDDSTREVIMSEPTEEVLEAQDYIQSMEFQKAPVTSRVLSSLDRSYSYVDPNHLVPTKLLASALAYFDANQSKIANKNHVSVIDFSAHASKSRFFIIDMKSGTVQAFHVAHGSGSDSANDGYAEKFSNVAGSNASSLGYYLTAETYNGKHGLSLRLDGLSTTNSKVRSRAIVIHGASYVSDSNVKAGRSWGCPAVSMASRDKVIKMLKGGTLIYAGLSK